MGGKDRGGMRDAGMGGKGYQGRREKGDCGSGTWEVRRNGESKQVGKCRGNPEED